jgi:hypothetical protein
MRSSKILTLLAIGLALASSGCGALEAARSEQIEKQMAFEHRVDTAHVWVTTEAPPAGKPYSTLGELSYNRAVLARRDRRGQDQRQVEENSPSEMA